MSEPQVRATHYEVTLVPRELANGRWYTVHVKSHGRGKWIVYREHCEVGQPVPTLYCLGPDGAWFVPDDPSWFNAPDYELEEALTLARVAAPNVVVAGLSAAEEAAREATRHMFTTHPDLSAGPVRPGEEPT
jgi:hypothetical protein